MREEFRMLPVGIYLARAVSVTNQRSRMTGRPFHAVRCEIVGTKESVFAYFSIPPDCSVTPHLKWLLDALGSDIPEQILPEDEEKLIQWISETVATKSPLVALAVTHRARKDLPETAIRHVNFVELPRNMNAFSEVNDA